MPYNTPLSVGQAQEVTADMHELRNALEDHGTRVDEYIEKAEQTARRQQGLVYALAVTVVIAVVAVTVAAFGIRAVNNANQARSDARVGSCIQQNVVTRNVRTAVASALRSLVPPDTELTAEQQARLDAYDGVLANLLEYRQCDRDSINAYYENPPADPAQTP